MEDKMFSELNEHMVAAYNAHELLTKTVASLEEYGENVLPLAVENIARAKGMISTVENCSGSCNKNITVVEALEESRGVIMSIIGFFKQISVFISTFIAKYLVYLDDFIEDILRDYGKVRRKLLDMESRGRKLKDVKRVLMDENLMAWQEGKFVALSVAASTDPLEALEECFDLYVTDNYRNMVVESLKSFLDRDQEFKPVFKDNHVEHILKNNVPLMKKAFSVVCRKANDKDILVLGFRRRGIDVVERCKVLGISSSIVPYLYTAHTIPIHSSSHLNRLLSGEKVYFTTHSLRADPTYKRLYVLLDKAEEGAKGSKQFIEDITDIVLDLKDFNEVSDKLTWENIGFYNVFTTAITSIAASRTRTLTAVDGYLKVILQALEEV